MYGGKRLFVHPVIAIFFFKCQILNLKEIVQPIASQEAADLEIDMFWRIPPSVVTGKSSSHFYPLHFTFHVIIWSGIHTPRCHLELFKSILLPLAIHRGKSYSENSETPDP